MGEISSQMPPNTHPQAYLTAIAQKYQLKGIFYMDLWPIADSMVVLTEPDVMNQATVTRSLNMHPMAEEFMSPVVGKNVIATSNGIIWKKTHNAMAPAFSWSHIRSLVGVIVDECELFRVNLDKHAHAGETFSMEETAAKLIFDVIARIVFNFSLNAQTSGSADLTDLRDMIKLAEAQLSWNPLVKAKAFFQRKVVSKRLQVSIVNKIRERLSLLRSQDIVPSRKDPYSILDLMLREYVQESDKSEASPPTDLPPEYFEVLITK